MATPSVPLLPAPVAPLDSEVEQRIAALPTNDRMKAALRLVADGWTYRAAAEAVGYASQKDLHGWARRAGLLEEHSQRLVGGYKRIVTLGQQELERRLTDDPENISTKDLAVIAGIASDKIARWERWGQSEHGDPERGAKVGEALAKLAAMGGAQVTLRVEPLAQAEGER